MVPSAEVININTMAEGRGHNIMGTRNNDGGKTSGSKMAGL